MVAKKLNDAYAEAITRVLNEGKEIGESIELRNVMLEIKDIHNNTLRMRKGFSLEYMIAEFIWYFSGDNSTKFIGKFADMWNKISDNGVVNNSAYGYILMKKYHYNQIDTIVKLLKHDPNTRRAVLNINYPKPNVMSTKDEPCTLSLQYFIRDGRLYSTGVMRSNDLWFGFPYDIAFFTELQLELSRRLNIPVGTYTHFVGSMHIYDRDITNLIDSLENMDAPSYNPINMQYLIRFVQEIKDDIDKLDNPREQLIHMINDKHPEMFI